MVNNNAQNIACDYLIIGAGIIGLTIARELATKQSDAHIVVIDKEANSTAHGSGRNSGVIHAGFYYSADSLKAQFTRQGNQALKAYCHQQNLPINTCGKVVVAQSDADVQGIYELAARAKQNGVTTHIVDDKELREIEPNAKTHRVALFSPDTASADPAQVTQCVANEVAGKGVNIIYHCGFVRQMSNKRILTTDGRVILASKVINCAGLYADKIAKQFGFSQDKVIIPFKGIYLKYTKSDQPIHTNIYPVPNLKNPFLGVHFTVTVDQHIKIGPTAIPALWRENYQGLANFKWREMVEILGYEAKLFASNAFNFRDLAIEEWKKYQRTYFTKLASNMVHNIDLSGFTQWSNPGIRAQLLNTTTLQLEQDFIVESDGESIHILNAVSPAWTSSFIFAQHIVDTYL